MGASGWEYVVPYQRDLGAALTALRHQVFEQSDYLKPDYAEEFGVPDPDSVADLDQEPYWEFMGTCGTHSILDVRTVNPAESDPEEFGTITPLSESEYVELFGVARPGRAEYTPLANSERLHDYITGGRWTGRAAVLWDNGTPAEIVFWGYSGD